MTGRFMITLLALSFGTGVFAEALSDADEIIARANLAAYYAGADGRRSGCG